MRRVANVMQMPTWGGVQGLAATIARPLAEDGWSLVAVVPTGAGEVVDRLDSAGCEVVEVPMSRLRRTLDPQAHVRYARSFAAEVAGLSELLRELHVAAVQVNGVHHIHGAVAARRLRIPIVWQLHSDQPPLPVRAAMGPLIALTANVVMTSGATLVERYPGLGRLRQDLIPFHAPVDSERFRPDPARGRAVRDRLGLLPDRIVIGTVGGRGPNKNHGDLVLAFLRLRAKGWPVSLLIAGPRLDQHDQYYSDRVLDPLRRADALGTDAKIIDAGSDVPPVLNAMDVFVLPSRGEGASLAVGEAMASGLAVVANDVGGVSSSVIDGRTGLLNRSRTVDELERHLERVLRSQRLRTELAGAGRAFAVDNLTVAACVDAHRGAYETISSRSDSGMAER